MKTEEEEQGTGEEMDCPLNLPNCNIQGGKRRKKRRVRNNFFIIQMILANHLMFI